MRADTALPGQPATPRPLPRHRLIWTLGNLLLAVGLYLLLYVGGLLADERFNIWAASGDTELALVESAPPAPPAVLSPADAAITASPASGATPRPAASAARPDGEIREGPRYRALPQLNNPGSGRELNSLVPLQTETADFGPNTITRIAIPSIKVDRKVQPVGWRLEQQNGVEVAIWEVAKYAVGHHKNTANPGQPGNIVLAGHSGGSAYPFNDLYYVQPGDEVILWSDGQQHRYSVSARVVVDEIGPDVTAEQRRANATYIEPTASEQVTLVTCWPLTGPTKFSQRVIVQALPADAPDATPTPTP